MQQAEDRQKLGWREEGYMCKVRKRRLQKDGEINIGDRKMRI